MKRILVLVLALSLIMAGLAYAEVFELKYMRTGTDTLKARDKASGKDLWQSQVQTLKTKFNGKDFLYLKEEGAGIYGKDKKYKTWVSEAYYEMDGNQAVPYQTKLVYKDQKGKTLETITKYYDRKAEKVVCRINGKEKSFGFKADLIDKELLGNALQNYPFAEKRDVMFHLLTNEPTLYKITVEYRGRENLKVNGEEIECHKVQMIPDLGMLNLLGAFVPKTYFWYKIDAPHDFVKYEGLESGLGTPYIMLEAQSRK